MIVLFELKKMSQIKLISNTIKKLLKQNNMTYRDLAQHLSMSEANVKRIFSRQNFALDRLEEMCQALNISLSDLFTIVGQQHTKITQLTLEQEQELVNDTKLLLMAVCVRDGWRFKQIIEHYQITEHEGIRLLVKLDRLKFLQLLPENKYKLLIAPDFRWIPNGPLEQYISSEVIPQFMASSFTEENSVKFYLRGTYTQSSIDIIVRKLNQVAKEAALLNQEDAKLPLKDRQHMGLLTAMRPWELSRFSQLRKQ